MSYIYHGRIDTSGLNVLPNTPEVHEAMRIVWDVKQPMEARQVALAFLKSKATTVEMDTMNGRR